MDLLSKLLSGGGDKEIPPRLEIDLDRLISAIDNMSRDVAENLGDHADNHITGGGDEIDADQIDIDWNPSNSTPALVATFSTSLDHLTSHLKGIDVALATKVGTHTLDDVAVHTDVSAITEARGQLLHRGASTWGALSPGLVGKPLLSGGAGADLTYAVLGTVYGGTGIDTSASTGFAKVSTGTWSVSAVTDSINFHVSGGGGIVPAGTYGPLVVHFACTITAAELYSTTGTVTNTVMDIWKDTFANHPADNNDSICGAAPLTLAASGQVQDTTLTGWTTNIAAGDHLYYTLDSNSAATGLSATLRVTRTA